MVPVNGSDPADEWVRHGVDAQMSNNLPLAQKRYNDALRLDPRHVIAANNLAIVFAQSNLLGEALLTIERTGLVDPKHSVVAVNHALMALAAERVDDALAAARRAFELAPDIVEPMLALAMVLTTAGMAAESMPLYNRILDKDPKHALAGVNSCFVQTLTPAGPADLLKQRQRWYAANKVAGPVFVDTYDRTPDRPLRVGYVGGDFKSHSASFIFGRVLLHHTAAVEPYLYSSLPVDPAADLNTKKFQDAAGPRWRDITTLSDDDAAKLIRKDRIDILVDLAGHTNGGRLAVFCRKPAPIQATGWGFAHGTGIPEIDYFLADPVAVPEAERGDFAEKVVDLPCLVTMEEPTHYQLKGTSLPPLRKNGYVTFGAYARYEKMSDECLMAFAAILRGVPDSRLEFKDGGYRRPYSIRRVMSFMPDIDPARLLFSINTSHSDHMLAYQQADLCLDPWPHVGGVVALEQLYMGVPVLTHYGTQPAGRNTASVLTAMGRPEWVARSRDEYVDKAIEWSERTKELAAARRTLRDELLGSPVVKGYEVAVENAYRAMWRTYCSQE